MAYEEGSASSVQEFCTKIKTFLVANGWTLMRDTTYGSAQKEYILESSEYRGKKVYVGIRSYDYLDNRVYGKWFSSYGIAINIYTGYNNGAFNANINPACTLANDYFPSFCFSDSLYAPSPITSINYFIYTNGKCVVIHSRNNRHSGNAYDECYAGFFKPFFTPAEYEYPICLLTTSLVSGNMSGCESFLNKYNIANGQYYNKVFLPNNTYDDCPTYFYMSSNTDVLISSKNDSNNYTKTVDDKFILYPIYLFTSNNFVGIGKNYYGELFGVYSLFNTVSNGDIITDQSGKTYYSLYKNYSGIGIQNACIRRT